MPKNSKRPLVSIIIPVFNRFDLISETLDSIIGQTYNNWECIVVDDGSEDGTLDLIQKYAQKDKRIRLVGRDRVPKGAPTCRNIGFELSRGSLINWFDSDDLMHKDMLIEKVEALNANESLDFVVCRLANFQDQNFQDIEEIDYLLQSDQPLKDYISFRLRFYTPGPMFKRSFLEKLDTLFAENLNRNQEGELFFRALCESSHYGTIDKSLILRRIHKESIAKKYKHQELKQRNHQNFLYGKYILDYAHKNRKKTISKEFEIFHQLSLRNVRLALILESKYMKIALDQFMDVISTARPIQSIYMMLLLRFRILKWRLFNLF